MAVTLNSVALLVTSWQGSLNASIEMDGAPYSNSEYSEPYDSKNPVRTITISGVLSDTPANLTTFIDSMESLINCGTTIGDGAQSKRTAWVLATGSTDIPASKSYNVMVDGFAFSASKEDAKKAITYTLTLRQRPSAALE